MTPKVFTWQGDPGMPPFFTLHGKNAQLVKFWSQKMGPIPVLEIGPPIRRSLVLKTGNGSKKWAHRLTNSPLFRADSWNPLGRLAADTLLGEICPSQQLLISRGVGC